MFMDVPFYEGSYMGESQMETIYSPPPEYRARQIAWAYNYPPLISLPGPAGALQQNRTLQALRDPRTAQIIRVLP